MLRRSRLATPTRRPESRPSPPEHEFEGVTSIAMLKLALETCSSRRSTRTTSRSISEARSRARRALADAKWSASEGVAELFAQVHAALGNLDAAIRWYDEAIDVADGNVSLRAIEQRANLQVRRAWTRWKRQPDGRRRGARRRRPRRRYGSRNDPRGRRRVSRELMRLRPTAERASLCGSAMKRLALRRGRRRAIQQRTASDRRDEAVLQARARTLRCRTGCPTSSIRRPTTSQPSWHSTPGGAGWKLGNRPLLEAIRKSLAGQEQGRPGLLERRRRDRHRVCTKRSEEQRSHHRGIARG